MSDKEEAKIYDMDTEETEENMSDFNPCQFCPMMRYCPIANQYSNEGMEDTERQYYKHKNYPKNFPGKYPHFPKKHYYHKKNYPSPFYNPFMFPFFYNNWDDGWDEDSEDD